MPNIIYSGLQTPDGTIIESKHVHDYVVHLDANGKKYMLDGGHDYVRCTVHGDEKMITIYDNDQHDVVRKYFRWGRNYDASGNLLPKTEYILLKDMNDDHLDAVIQHPRIKDRFKRLFIMEKQFRNILSETF